MMMSPNSASVLSRPCALTDSWKGASFAGDAPSGYVPTSNTFELEWPPRSGKRRSFPEVDRAEFFSLEVARTKLLAAQLPFLDRLLEKLER